MNSAQALHAFWQSFGLNAYDENTVPTNAALPYITYTVALNEFEEPVALSASIWYRSMSWADITAKSEEIYSAIGLGGRVLESDEGGVWVKRGTPFAQRMRDDDDTIRRMYLNIEVEYFKSN